MKKLKEDVNQVRRERVIFDSVFKKLEQDLKLRDDDLMQSLSETIKHEKIREEILEELKIIKALYNNQKQTMMERKCLNQNSKRLSRLSWAITAGV